MLGPSHADCRHRCLGSWRKLRLFPKKSRRSDLAAEAKERGARDGGAVRERQKSLTRHAALFPQPRGAGDRGADLISLQPLRHGFRALAPSPGSPHIPPQPWLPDKLPPARAGCSTAARFLRLPPLLSSRGNRSELQGHSKTPSVQEPLLALERAGEKLFQHAEGHRPPLRRPGCMPASCGARSAPAAARGGGDRSTPRLGRPPSLTPARRPLAGAGAASHSGSREPPHYEGTQSLREQTEKPPEASVAGPGVWCRGAWGGHGYKYDRPRQANTPRLPR